MEKLAEKAPSSTKCQKTNVEDYEDELVRKSKRHRTDVGTPAADEEAYNEGMPSAISGMYPTNFMDIVVSSTELSPFVTQGSIHLASDNGLGQR